MEHIFTFARMTGGNSGANFTLFPPLTTKSPPVGPRHTACAFDQSDRIRQLLRVDRTFQMLFSQDNRRLSLIAAGILLLATPQPFAGPVSPREATVQEARHLAWLNNWTEAALLLDRLEDSGLPGDEAIDLFAKAAHIRGNIEGMSLPAAADEVASMLASDRAQKDFDLRIELLAIKGGIEFQYNLPAAQATWEEALQLASSQGRER